MTSRHKQLLLLGAIVGSCEWLLLLLQEPRKLASNEVYEVEGWNALYLSGLTREQELLSAGVL